MLMKFVIIPPLGLMVRDAVACEIDFTGFPSFELLVWIDDCGAYKKDHRMKLIYECGAFLYLIHQYEAKTADWDEETRAANTRQDIWDYYMYGQEDKFRIWKTDPEFLESDINLDNHDDIPHI